MGNHIFRMHKPPRWSVGRYQDSKRGSGNISTGGAITVVPLWEGNGNRVSTLSGQLHPGFLKGNATWQNGLGGIGVRTQGVLTDHVEFFNSAASLRFQKDYPLTIEVVFEMFAGSGTNRNVIFANDGTATSYSGIMCGTNNTDKMMFQIGDNSGSSSSDRSTFVGATTLVTGKLYHVICTISSATVGRIYINGVSEGSITRTGTATNIGYNSASKAYIGGGLTANSDGFDGITYYVGLHNKIVHDAEARAMFRDPYRALRRMRERITTEGADFPEVLTGDFDSTMLLRYPLMLPGM